MVLTRRICSTIKSVTIGFRAQTGNLNLRGRHNNNWGKSLGRDHSAARTETRHDSLVHGDLLRVSLYGRQG